MQMNRTRSYPDLSSVISCQDLRHMDWTLRGAGSDSPLNYAPIALPECLCQISVDPLRKLSEAMCNRLLHIVRRIGSKSMDAVVFAALLFNSAQRILPRRNVLPQKVAVKFMPVESERRHRRNLEEIAIAKRASQLVLRGISSHFLLVYGSTSCQSVLLPQESEQNFCNSIFLSRAQRALARTGAPATQQSLEVKRLLAALRSNLDDEKFIAVCSEMNLHCDLNKYVSCDVLVAEYAWGDLKTWLHDYSLTFADWINVLSQVFEAIDTMQKHMQVLHNDLHLGNVLMMLYNKQALCIIHDFGQAEYPVDFGTAEKRTHDALKFIDSCKREPDVKHLPPFLLDFCEKFLKTWTKKNVSPYPTLIRQIAQFPEPI